MSGSGGSGPTPHPDFRPELPLEACVVLATAEGCGCLETRRRNRGEQERIDLQGFLSPPGAQETAPPRPCAPTPAAGWQTGAPTVSSSIPCPFPSLPPCTHTLRAQHRRTPQGALPALPTGHGAPGLPPTCAAHRVLPVLALVTFEIHPRRKPSQLALIRSHACLPFPPAPPTPYMPRTGGETGPG